MITLLFIFTGGNNQNPKNLIRYLGNPNSGLCSDNVIIEKNTPETDIYHLEKSNITIEFPYNPSWPVKPYKIEEPNIIYFGLPFFGHESCQESLDRDFILIETGVSESDLIKKIKYEYGENAKYEKYDTKIGNTYIVEAMDSIYSWRALVSNSEAMLDIHWSNIDKNELKDFLKNKIKYTSEPSQKPIPTRVPFVLNTENLVGVWQDSGGVAAGYTNHYVFYPSGKYSFNYNQMDGCKRIAQESGQWEYNNTTDILALTVKQKTILKKVDPLASCDWWGWEGAIWVTEPVSKETTMKYQLSVPTKPFKIYKEYTYDPNDYDNPYEVVIFNDKPFWEIRSDLDDEGEEFPEPTGF